MADKAVSSKFLRKEHEADILCPPSDPIIVESDMLPKLPSASPASGEPAAKKKQYHILTVERKLEIIRHNEEGQGVSEIGRALGLAASTTGTVTKKKKMYKKMATLFSTSTDGYKETIEVHDGVDTKGGLYGQQEDEEMEGDVLSVRSEKSKRLEGHGTSELQHQEDGEAYSFGSESNISNDDILSDSETVSSEENEDRSESNTESDTESRVMITEGPWQPITKQDHGPRPIPFLAVAGVKHALPSDSKPVDYVKLFITENFVHTIVTETNRYGEEWIKQNHAHLKSHPKSRVHQWKKDGIVTAEEMYAFLAVLLNMGLVRKASVSEYWDLSHPSQATPWFSQLFHRERFQLILKFLQFTDIHSLSPEHDKFAKIQPVIDHLKSCFSKHFHPGKDITVTEDIHEFKERAEGKDSQFGVKIVRLCDLETGYTTTFEVIKSGLGHYSMPEEMGYQLVMKLMQQSGLFFCGHHLSLLKGFCTPDLLLDLYDKGTTATGIARNHNDLPKQCLGAKLNAKEVREWRQGPVLCVTHRDKTKKQTFLSTVASAGYTNVVTKSGRSVKKPKIVEEYSKIASALSQKDNDIYSLMFERRTIKWTTMITLSLIGTAMLNAYILYTKQTTHNHILTRRQFVISAIESLASDFLELSQEKVNRKKVTSSTSQSSSGVPARSFTSAATKEVDVLFEERPLAAFPQSCTSSRLSIDDVTVENFDSVPGLSRSSTSAKNFIAVPSQNLSSRSHKKFSAAKSKSSSTVRIQSFSNTKTKPRLEMTHTLVRRKGDKKRKCSGIINHHKTFRTRLMCKQCNIGMCRLCYPKHLEKFSL